MSDKKSDHIPGRMSNGATNGHNGDAHRSKPFPSFTPALAKTDALKGLGPSMSSLDNNRGASVFAYCLSSMSMTIVNKYVVSGSNWNMNLLYLAVQVCFLSLPLSLLFLLFFKDLRLLRQVANSA